jgi:hypothetical protein
MNEQLGLAPAEAVRPTDRWDYSVMCNGVQHKVGGRVGNAFVISGNLQATNGADRLNSNIPIGQKLKSDG